MNGFLGHVTPTDLRDVAIRGQMTFDDYLRTARFEGPDLTVADCARLEGQIKRIYELMRDARWRTLPEIAEITGAPEASASAQLRHLRKARWGSHTVNRRRREDDSGLREYQLIVRDPDRSLEEEAGVTATEMAGDYFEGGE